MYTKTLLTFLVAASIGLFLSPCYADICLEKVMNLNSVHVFIRRIPDTLFYIFVQRSGEVWLLLEDPDSGSIVNTGQRLAFNLEDRIDFGSSFRELIYHPDWENNHKVYAHYSCDPAKCPIPQDDCDVTGRPRPFECTPESMLWNAQLSEYTLEYNPTTGLFDVGNERILLTMGYPDRFHGGGGMDFDEDGYLVLAIGDGAAYRNINGWAQDMTNRRGKVIRIDVDTTGGQPFKGQPLTKPYGIPADNPYYDNDNGWRREIYAIGLRQPYRCIRDKMMDVFLCGSIGEIGVETLWNIKKGENYGWAHLEGTVPFTLYPYNAFENDLAPGWTVDQVTPPVMEWCRGAMCGEVQRSSAIISGDIYRGTKNPEFYGKFFAGDWEEASPWVYVVDVEPDAPVWNHTIHQYQCPGCDGFFEGYLEHIETAVNGDLLFLFDNGLMRMIESAECGIDNGGGNGGGGGIIPTKPPQEFIDVPYFYRDFENPEEIVSSNGVLTTTLEVTSTRHSAGLINGASSDTVLEFNSRVYNGKLPGPTIRFKAGDQVNVKLKNSLAQPLVPYGGSEWNEFDKAQMTNLHTHGLHVSPKGNADNVWIEVGPGEEFDYSYDPHADHAPGMSYYHSHLHGAGYIQVMGGLYGAMIVDLPDDELYDPLRNLPEHIIMLGLVNSNGIDDSESYERVNLVSGSPFPAAVASGLEGFQYYALVNGVFQPTMAFGTNQLQHMRFTNTGSQGFLLQTDADCSMYELAKDAIYLEQPIPVETVYLGPANRADVLIICRSAGLFSLYSNTTAEVSEVNGNVVKQDVLYMQVNAAPAGPTNINQIKLPPLPDYLPDMRGSLERPIYKAQDISMDYGEKISGEKLECRGCLSEVWKVGRVYEVNISTTAFHPLHMHINHFQIIDWQYDGGKHPDLVFFREGERRDTIPLVSGLKVTVRFYLDNYTGLALSHCHLAHHADKGMMRLQYIAEDSDLDARDHYQIKSIFLDDPHPIDRRLVSVWISDDCTSARLDCTEDDESLKKTAVDTNGEEYYTLPLIPQPVTGSYVYWTFDRGQARHEDGTFIEFRGSPGAFQIQGGWSAPFSTDPLEENTNYHSALNAQSNSLTGWQEAQFLFRDMIPAEAPGFDPQNLFAASLGFVGLTGPATVEVKRAGFVREVPLEDEILYELGELFPVFPTRSPTRFGETSAPIGSFRPPSTGGGDITDSDALGDIGMIAGASASALLLIAAIAFVYMRSQRTSSSVFAPQYYENDVESIVA